VPTLFQLFAAVQDGSMNFRAAYRLARALDRAAMRRRETQNHKGQKP